MPAATAIRLWLLAALVPLVLATWASPSEAGHPVESGLRAQGLLPGSTGLDAPLGDAAPPRPQARSAGSSSSRPLRVYVVVVDGLLPQEVGTATPTLKALRDGGTWYEQARAVLPAETLPNHAAMATGVLPQRNGIVANQFFRFRGPREYMQHPEFLEADTIVTRLERAYDAHGGIETATIMSKEYLYGVFRGERAGEADPLPQRQADFHWDPRAQPLYVVNPSDHALDVATTDAFLTWLRARRDSRLPQFAFVNLGDVDRAGHADESGAATAAVDRASHPGDDELSGNHISPFRQAALEATDRGLATIVEELKDSGAWENTVLIVLSDHGMDWGPSDEAHEAKIATALQEKGYRMSSNGDPSGSDFYPVGGGGSELIYPFREADAGPMADVLRSADATGVSFIATRVPTPGSPTLAQLGLDHPYSPDIEAFTKPTYRSSPPCGQCSANPLPGNHGHSVTQHAALFVAGGHPAVRDQPHSVPGERVYVPTQRPFAPPAGGPGVLSVAPTVAALFGLSPPPGGYAVPPLTAAFDSDAFSARRASESGSGPGGPQGPFGLLPTAPEPLTTSLRASRRVVTAGRRFTLSGQVSDRAGCGSPLRITLYAGDAARPAAARVVATSIAVSADGTWSRTLTARVNRAYFARVQPTRSCEGSLSPPVAVRVRALVRIAPGCPNVTGRVLPAAPGTRVVLERRDGRRYRRVAARRLDRASRFAFRLRSCRARHRVVWSGRPARNLAGTATFVPRLPRRGAAR